MAHDTLALKGYLLTSAKKKRTSQNVPSDAQIKNVFVS